MRSTLFCQEVNEFCLLRRLSHYKIATNDLMPETGLVREERVVRGTNRLPSMAALNWILFDTLNGSSC